MNGKICSAKDLISTDVHLAEKRVETSIELKKGVAIGIVEKIHAVTSLKTGVHVHACNCHIHVHVYV